MPKYDYACSSSTTHEWEEQRSHAERTAPARCPSCGAVGAFVFHPSSDIMVPRAFMTRWSDIAPIDRDGHAMSFTETVKSKQFDRFRREDREEAEAADAAHEARMEPIRKQRAVDNAWKRMKNAEKRGLKVFSDADRAVGMALAQEGDTA